MTQTADLTKRAAWGSGIQGGSGNSSRIRDTGAGLLCEMFDGDSAPWNDVPGQTRAEVAQVQRSRDDKGQPIFPYGEARWIRVRMTYEAIANEPSGDWHFCLESHLNAGGTSAPWAINLKGSQHQFAYTPVGWKRIFPAKAFRDAKPGEEFEMVIGHLPHTSNGFFEVWYDGKLVWETRGVRTIAVAETSYLKVGWYRPIGVTGRDAVVFHEITVHDAVPVGTPPPPPPPPDPEPEPTVTLPAAQVVRLRDNADVLYGGLGTAVAKWKVLLPSHRKYLTDLRKRAAESRDLLD